MSQKETLLYRLIELMLDKQQPFLLLDDLYEDEVISPFVRNIQIDSPFQQLIFDGVLTQSVSDEKLYVSFTVERFFHYVLGEVIYIQTKGREPKVLKKIVEENNLYGVKEGVEQCLIRDIQKNDLTRLIWLIDNLPNSVQVCIQPLAYAFMNCSYENLQKEIRVILKKLFKNYSLSDSDVISEVIFVLKELNKEDHIRVISSYVCEKISPESFQEYELIIKLSEFLDISKRNRFLKIYSEDLGGLKEIPKNLNFEIGYQYELLSMYEMSINFYKKCLRKDLFDKQFHIKLNRHLAQVYLYIDEFEKAIYYAKKSNKLIENGAICDEFSKSCNYSTIGEAFRQKESFSRSKHYQKLSLDISLTHFGKYDITTATSFNNIGLTYRTSGDYKKAIEFYEESLRIKNNLFVSPNQSIIVTLNNLGVSNRYIGRYIESISYYKKSLKISNQLNGKYHITTATIHFNLCIVYKNNNDINKAIKSCQKSLEIFEEILGNNHSTTALAVEKLNELKTIQYEKH